MRDKLAKGLQAARMFDVASRRRSVNVLKQNCKRNSLASVKCTLHTNKTFHLIDECYIIAFIKIKSGCLGVDTYVRI